MPRKRSPNSTSDRQRIQFAYNADRDTPIGEVFKYLLKSDKLPSRKGKHKGLNAMLAFWQPFAFQEKDGLSDEEKVVIAKEAIDSLSQQIDLIRETFGIEPPATSTSSVQSSEEVRAIAAAVVKEFVASGDLSPQSASSVTPPVVQTATATSNQSAASTTEGVDFDEDALLGGLFDGAEIAA